MGLLCIVYAIAAYWAAGQTIYANKIRIGTWMGLFCSRMAVGFCLGFVLIPIAIFKSLKSR